MENAMRKVYATLLLLAGMFLVILGARYPSVSVLGELTLLGTGSCLIFVAAAVFAGLAVFSKVWSTLMIFLTWLRP